MFGYSEKEGEIQTDPYSIKPILTSKYTNWEWSDEEIIHRIAASKGLITYRVVLNILILCISFDSITDILV